MSLAGLDSMSLQVCSPQLYVSLPVVRSTPSLSLRMALQAWMYCLRNQQLEKGGKRMLFSPTNAAMGGVVPSQPTKQKHTLYKPVDGSASPSLAPHSYQKRTLFDPAGGSNSPSLTSFKDSKRTLFDPTSTGSHSPSLTSGSASPSLVPSISSTSSNKRTLFQPEAADGGSASPLLLSPPESTKVGKEDAVSTGERQRCDLTTTCLSN